MLEQTHESVRVAELSRIIPRAAVESNIPLSVHLVSLNVNPGEVFLVEN